MKDFKSQVYQALKSGPKNKAHMCKAIGRAISYFSMKKNKKKLDAMVKSGEVQFNGKQYSLGITTDSTAEENLLQALQRYVQQKKGETFSNYETIQTERDYYENLCKEYKEKIDMLETENANTKFKLW